MVMCHKKRVFTMVLFNKKESIYYSTVSQQEETLSHRRVTRRRVSIMALCHKNESI